MIVNVPLRLRERCLRQKKSDILFSHGQIQNNKNDKSCNMTSVKKDNVGCSWGDRRRTSHCCSGVVVVASVWLAASHVKANCTFSKGLARIFVTAFTHLTTAFEVKDLIECGVVNRVHLAGEHNVRQRAVSTIYCRHVGTATWVRWSQSTATVTRDRRNYCGEGKGNQRSEDKLHVDLAS